MDRVGGEEEEEEEEEEGGVAMIWIWMRGEL